MSISTDSNFVWVANTSGKKPNSCYDLIEDVPYPSSKYSSDDLSKMGIVGWYRRVQNNTEPCNPDGYKVGT